MTAAGGRPRILLVSNYFPEHVGGVETVADNLASRYRSRGYRVFWAAAQVGGSIHRGHEDDVALPAWNFTEERLGFPFPVLHPSSLGPLLQAIRRSDVLHVHDCLYQASAIATLAARRLHRPVLLTQHVGAVPYRQRPLRTLQQLAYRGPGRLVLSQANAITFVSQPVATWFGDFVRRARTAPVIPNGVDAGIFHPVSCERRRALRSELELPGKGPLLLFCGRFVQKKGLHLLREIARSNPQWSWLFIGRPGDVDPAAWQLANVRVLGTMPATRLASYYQAADLLTLPSTGEGFPVAVQEAMACGTPAVISDELGDSVPPSLAFPTRRTVDAVTDAIGRALEALETDHSLRERVSAFAHQRWDWGATVGRYEALLARLVAYQQGHPREAIARS